MSAANGSVLVVEDEACVRALVQEILTGEGYRVLETSDPWEALDVAHAQPFHLLLTDMKMPRMNGRELARRIESIRPDAKVLYMSASDPGDMLDAGARFIAKPFGIDHILHTVSDVLGR
jgi:CheY-like chemotaxis protein